MTGSSRMAAWATVAWAEVTSSSDSGRMIRSIADQVVRDEGNVATGPSTAMIAPRAMNNTALMCCPLASIPISTGAPTLCSQIARRRPPADRPAAGAVDHRHREPQ